MTTSEGGTIAPFETAQVRMLDERFFDLYLLEVGFWENIMPLLGQNSDALDTPGRHPPFCAGGVTS